ncbi:MAG: hypothetical protein IH845_02820 [Nanoarchaeota archaeon]|nr:hypothetical protein [Nanoarchaeota archaeon]
MSQLGKEKRAISNIIAYVMLISISISLSIMVFSWLRFYVADDTVETCPEGVSLIVQNYICSYGFANGSGNENARLNITLKNKGLFNIDGFVLGVNDRVGAGVGIYILDENGTFVEPGKSVNLEYNISNKYISDGGYNNRFDAPIDRLTFVQIQPFRTNENGDLLCATLSSQVIDTCP